MRLPPARGAQCLFDNVMGFSFQTTFGILNDYCYCQFVSQKFVDAMVRVHHHNMQV